MENHTASGLRAAARRIGLTAESRSSRERNGAKFGDVQQRKPDGGLHLVGHAVHRVCADHHEIRAAALQPLRGSDHFGGGISQRPELL